MLYCIHRYVVLGVVVGVVVIVVFGLFVYQVDNHVDSTIRKGVEEVIVHFQDNSVLV